MQFPRVAPPASGRVLAISADYAGKPGFPYGAFDPVAINRYVTSVGLAIERLSRGQTRWTSCEIRRVSLPGSNLETTLDDAAVDAVLRPALADVDWSDIVLVVVDGFGGKTRGWFDVFGDGSLFRPRTYTWFCYGNLFHEWGHTYKPRTLSPFEIEYGPALSHAVMAADGEGKPVFDFAAAVFHAMDPNDGMGTVSDWLPTTMWWSNAHSLLCGWYRPEEFTLVVGPGDYALPVAGPPFGLLILTVDGVYCVERGVPQANGQAPGAAELRMIPDAPVRGYDTLRIPWARGTAVWDPVRSLAVMDLDGTRIRIGTSPLTPSVTTTPALPTTPPPVVPTTTPPPTQPHKPPKKPRRDARGQV